jgi:hypothetical protein
MKSCQNFLYLLAFALIIATTNSFFSSSSRSIVEVSATAPPHGHKPLKSNDPRHKHDHTLHEPIKHVYDVKAEYMRHYMREVPGHDNRMTLVVLYTTWCGAPCDAWVSVLGEIALRTREAQIAHRLSIVKHDVTKDDVIAHKLKVDSFPAIGLVEAAHHSKWEFIKYDGAAKADAVIAWMEANSPEHFQEAHGKLKSVSRSKSV